jgi:uncharacterized protein (TIGR02118 family)
MTRENKTMARLIAIYSVAAEVAAFEKHYNEQHIPLAKKLPGLRRYEVSTGPVFSPAGPSGFQLVAILHFDDMAAIGAAFASAEGQAAAADAQRLGIAHLLFFDENAV